LKIQILLAFVTGAFLNGPVSAQTAASDTVYAYVDSIRVEGNRQTHTRLILRELEFGPGDSIPLASLNAVLERNNLRVLNLNLFTGSKTNVLTWKPGNHLILQIKVTETWFIFPVPVFALADRNFNVWWEEFHGSLKRVNYGIDLSHNNLTGSADVLKARLGFGYNNNYALSYRFPPLNRDQTLRLQAGVSYNRQHELSYATVGDKLLFKKNPSAFLFTQTFAFANLTWRPLLNTTHSFTLEYRDNQIADSVVVLNPDFFLNGQKRQHHFSLVYNLRSDHRDIQPYPLNGYLAQLEVRQNGLIPADNLFLFRTFAEYAWYKPLVKHLYLEVDLKGRFSLPRNKPPYYNNQALGYFGNFVRGYEYYVADGLDFGVLKTSFHYELVNHTFELGKFMPFKAFKTLPIKIYLTLNNDLGYANDPYYAINNPLTNRLLYGHGFGLDIVAWYNKIARLEYSWNDLGQSGFYLRIDSGF
jgi:outer membrane protein assembly factor BamA